MVRDALGSSEDRDARFRGHGGKKKLPETPVVVSHAPHPPAKQVGHPLRRAPAMPGTFRVPLSKRSGRNSGCSSRSDRLPVPPRVNGGSPPSCRT